MTRRQASEWLESVEGGINRNSEREQVSTGYPQKETTDEEASWNTERNRASEGDACVGACRRSESQDTERKRGMRGKEKVRALKEDRESEQQGLLTNRVCGGRGERAYVATETS